ncbi:MAG: YraN family protein [Candidatus Dojkabacteria bacterium]|nr:MAG: YraN family protein [Candidatus Dojkabacteria bacterium]
MKLQVFGESLISHYLQLQGVRIIGRNIYCKPYGEIDILCVWKQYLLCIEVKTRLLHSIEHEPRSPPITQYKTAKLQRALNQYIMSHRRYSYLQKLCVGYIVYIHKGSHNCSIQRVLLC